MCLVVALCLHWCGLSWLDVCMGLALSMRVACISPCVWSNRCIAVVELFFCMGMNMRLSTGCSCLLLSCHGCCLSFFGLLLLPVHCCYISMFDACRCLCCLCLAFVVVHLGVMCDYVLAWLWSTRVLLLHDSGSVPVHVVFMLAFVLLLLWSMSLLCLLLCLQFCHQSG